MARLELPSSGQVMVHDDRLPGFAVRLTPRGTRSWVVYRRVQGRPQVVTLGRFPELNAKKARDEAQKALGDIAGGVNPTAHKRAERQRGVTVGELFRDYLAARGPHLKPRTRADYQGIATRYFGDWSRREARAITRDMVERRHRQLTEDHGPAQANYAARVLRAVFNFAADRYEDAQGRPLLPDNPVRRLSAGRLWHRVNRRRRIVPAGELGAWWDAVEALHSDTGRDCLLLMLLTGLRSGEARRLRWEDVNLARGTLTVADTKNRDPLELPLSDYLAALLHRRRELVGDPWVFPGGGAGGPIGDLRGSVERVTRRSGVAFTPHDLRRTFATTAEGLDIPHYALKALLNHRMPGGPDVTGGYISFDVERLRGPMQRITDKLLAQAGRAPAADVVPLGTAKRKRGRP